MESNETRVSSLNFRKEMVNIMKEQYIKFVDKNVDGCGTDITIYCKVYGNEITVGTVDRIKDAIYNYKNENEGEWDTDGCLDVATEQLKTEGYEVCWVNENAEICF